MLFLAPPPPEIVASPTGPRPPVAVRRSLDSTDRAIDILVADQSCRDARFPVVPRRPMERSALGTMQAAASVRHRRSFEHVAGGQHRPGNFRTID